MSLTWQGAYDLLTRQAAGAEVRLPFGAVPHPKRAGAVSSPGLGPLGSWRFPPDSACRGLHAEDGGRGVGWRVHLDRVHPACGLGAHFLRDVLRVGQDVPSEYPADVESALAAAATSTEAQSAINNALQGLGLPPGVTPSSISAAYQSIANFVGSGAPASQGFAAAAPLVGLALTASGVGAPFALLATTALTALSALLGQLGGQGCVPNPDAWIVGNGICISGTKPWGLQDPTWESFESFATETSALGWSSASLAEQAFPWWNTLARDMAAAGGHPTAPWLGLTLGGAIDGAIIPNADPAVAGFVLAFAASWMRNKELPINGYPAANDYAIALLTAGAWNQTHVPTSTYTFEPVGGGGVGALGAVAPVLYLEALLNGDVDGQRYQPITINTGPYCATMEPDTDAPGGYRCITQPGAGPSPIGPAPVRLPIGGSPGLISIYPSGGASSSSAGAAAAASSSSGAAAAILGGGALAALLLAGGL